ncbi:MAG: hypothetical protein JWO48_672, partial [Bryobacterales bacterium]|nr:hypothetical protein [Bryobacterales bacterium]
MRTVLAILALACPAFAVGTVQQSLTPLGVSGNYALTFYWTGDTANGSVPVTAAQLGAASAQGYRVLQVETVPGSPSPTAGYSVQILDGFGGDIMSGALAGLSATAAQFFGANAGTPPILGTFSLSITGQNIVGSTGKVIVYFGPTQLVNANAGGPGPAGPIGPAGSSGLGILATAYNFAAQTPGGSLSAGIAATVTMLPCPTGLNGADSGHYLYISGGTGTAEAVLITGGTCTSGAGTGTVVFTPANSHTGGWTVTSASGGIQEAVCGLPSTGGDVVATVPVVLQANVSFCGKNPVSIRTTGVTGTGVLPSSDGAGNIEESWRIRNFATGPSADAASGLEFFASNTDGRGSFLSVTGGHDPVGTGLGNVSLDIWDRFATPTRGGETRMVLHGVTSGSCDPNTKACVELTLTKSGATSTNNLNLFTVFDTYPGGYSPGPRPNGAYRFGQECPTSVCVPIDWAQENGPGITAGTEAYMTFDPVRIG